MLNLTAFVLRSSQFPMVHFVATMLLCSLKSHFRAIWHYDSSWQLELETSGHCDAFRSLIRCIFDGAQKPLISWQTSNLLRFGHVGHVSSALLQVALDDLDVPRLKRCRHSHYSHSTWVKDSWESCFKPPWIDVTWPVQKVSMRIVSLHLILMRCDEHFFEPPLPRASACWDVVQMQWQGLSTLSSCTFMLPHTGQSLVDLSPGRAFSFCIWHLPQLLWFQGAWFLWYCLNQPDCTWWYMWTYGDYAYLCDAEGKAELYQTMVACLQLSDGIFITGYLVSRMNLGIISGTAFTARTDFADVEWIWALTQQ